MTLRLTVHRSAWLQHVRTTAEAYDGGLVPVVKGNGYGFGRPALLEVAGALSTTVCVGTVHELPNGGPVGHVVVLTPTLDTPPNGTAATLTVGSIAHVRALRGWRGQVMVKLESSMRRYGATRAELADLLHAVEAAGLDVAGFAMHLPLAGDDEARLAEVTSWLTHLPEAPLWLSHLTPESFHRLRAAHPHRDLRVRVGTALWHGVPRGEFVHLSADVVHSRQVRAGEQAGYRLTPAPFDGTLLCIGAGSTHGVTLLEHADPSRRSPFHFARQRLPVLERPHMHTTMCVVPGDQPCPMVGDAVDVQQPLINVHVDEVEWRP